jgi:hypothetical protein
LLSLVTVTLDGRDHYVELYMSSAVGRAERSGARYFYRMSIDAVIAAERLLLERLEHFACTPEYARLLDTVTSHMDDGPERWPAHWLIARHTVLADIDRYRR